MTFQGGAKNLRGGAKQSQGSAHLPSNAAVACSVCKGQTGSTLLTCERGGDIIVQMHNARTERIKSQSKK